MGYKTVVFSNPCKLSLKLDNLKFEAKNQDEILVPLSDISVIILETNQITITSALLSEFANKDISVFTCDGSHIPNGLFLPFHQHSRYSLMSELQIKWSEPFKKQCWQNIISQKVKNQANVLKYFKYSGEKTLQNLSNQVKSGDSTNIEGYAAREYFSHLFGAFNRKNDDDWRNKALNYGYAIVRGVVARDLVSCGFLPFFGLHHKNQLNAFNLADDIIEPFRPFVDILVNERYEEQVDKIVDRKNTLTKEDRNYLCEILNIEVCINNHTTSLQNASLITCNSLANATKNQKSSEIILPKLDNS
ncbi:MAG: type II CRISPR-associated endonuclease Cas1 [Campylobacteraceae bacterium]